MGLDVAIPRSARRAANQSRRADIAREAAKLAEERDEAMVPRAQRLPVIVVSTGEIVREPLVEPVAWRDPDDDAVQARRPREVHGFRRVDVLRNLHVRGGLVTRLHLTAAARFVADYERGILGASASSRPLVRVDGTQHHPSDTRLAAATRYREACAAIGIRGCLILRPVALENATIAAVAPLLGMDAHAAAGFLAATLDRLAEHYGLDTR